MFDDIYFFLEFFILLYNCYFKDLECDCDRCLYECLWEWFWFLNSFLSIYILNIDIHALNVLRLQRVAMSHNLINQSINQSTYGSKSPFLDLWYRLPLVRNNLFWVYYRFPIARNHPFWDLRYGLPIVRKLFFYDLCYQLIIPQNPTYWGLWYQLHIV